MTKQKSLLAQPVLPCRVKWIRCPAPAPEVVVNRVHPKPPPIDEESEAGSLIFLMLRLMFWSLPIPLEQLWMKNWFVAEEVRTKKHVLSKSPDS